MAKVSAYEFQRIPDLSLGPARIDGDLVVIGSINAANKILTSPPSNPADLTYWIETSGTSPNEIISLMVQRNGATYTLASIQL